VKGAVLSLADLGISAPTAIEVFPRRHGIYVSEELARFKRTQIPGIDPVFETKVNWIINKGDMIYHKRPLERISQIQYRFRKRSGKAVITLAANSSDGVTTSALQLIPGMIHFLETYFKLNCVQ
jgi:hypothetical protein